ncbi:MAG: Fe-S cluster assembly protein SufD [Deltaproteobacteria bacterium]|nr:Fe-S cluster assembly protein SufD [Deltaproteobacteria bacterium]
MIPLSPQEWEHLIFDGCYLAVFVNGHFLPELSKLPKISGVNASFADEASISLSKGVILDKPFQLLFLQAANGKPAATFPKIRIVAGENSQARIIESYDGFILEPAETNTVTDLMLGPNAVVEHFKVQDEAVNTTHNGHIQVQQEASSHFTSHNISLGGIRARTEISVRLNDEGCECTLNGLYLGNGSQVMDSQIRIDHLKPHGTSHQLYKGILDGKSRGIFNGKVVVHPGAQKTDADQTNNNLLLSKEAEADPNPALEILADDVKVRHGATVGQLDKDHLYYLRSRGIDEAAAKSLLTYAFASDVINRITFEPVKARLKNALIAHLPSPPPFEKGGLGGIFI